MHDLDKKIEDYSEELFVDLGLVSLTEEEKADIYARLQDHLHAAIIATADNGGIRSSDLERIKESLDQEDYEALGDILKKYPAIKEPLDDKIEQEFMSFKTIIGKEHENVRRNQDPGKTAAGDTGGTLF